MIVLIVPQRATRTMPLTRRSGAAARFLSFSLYRLMRSRRRLPVLLMMRTGLGKYKVKIEEAAFNHFAQGSNGDVRSALNALELAVISSEPDNDGVIHITLAIAEECLQKKSLAHDKDGDAHYDVLSAFQKSIRGSDANAALHYLEAG